MHTPLPVLLRTKVLADAADPDWAATQVSPGALLRDAALLAGTLIVCVPRDADGDPVDESVTVQLVAARSVPDASPLVWAAPAEAAPCGIAHTYDLRSVAAFTIRVVDAAAAAGAGAVTVDLYAVGVA